MWYRHFKPHWQYILEIQASGPDAAIWSAQRPMGCLFGLLHVALGDLRCQGVWGTGYSTCLHCVGVGMMHTVLPGFAARCLRLDTVWLLVPPTVPFRFVHESSDIQLGIRCDTARNRNSWYATTVSRVCLRYGSLVTRSLIEKAADSHTGLT